LNRDTDCYAHNPEKFFEVKRQPVKDRGRNLPKGKFKKLEHAERESVRPKRGRRKKKWNRLSERSVKGGPRLQTGGIMNEQEFARKEKRSREGEDRTKATERNRANRRCPNLYKRERDPGRKGTPCTFIGKDKKQRRKRWDLQMDAAMAHGRGEGLRPKAKKTVEKTQVP